jgi:16S rRNA (guanine527-N7)-methyltransferase
VTLTRGVSARLAELAERYEVPPAGVRALDALLVLGAGDPTAPTTVRDPREAVDRHVADSLVALDLPAVRAARRIADLGAGAGWPGIALAAALPDAQVALVESAVRHCRYVERAVGLAELSNVSVVHARAEEWAEGMGVHDLVTARALAALPVVCEYSAPLLASGGTLVAWKGAVGPEEAADGAAAAEVLGLAVAEVRRVQPFAGARDRTLHVLHKVAETPTRFPRRAGIATKRPLTANS